MRQYIDDGLTCSSNNNVSSVQQLVQLFNYYATHVVCTLYPDRFHSTHTHTHSIVHALAHCSYADQRLWSVIAVDMPIIKTICAQTKPMCKRNIYVWLTTFECSFRFWSFWIVATVSCSLKVLRRLAGETIRCVIDVTLNFMFEIKISIQQWNWQH